MSQDSRPSTLQRAEHSLNQLKSQLRALELRFDGFQKYVDMQFELVSLMSAQQEILSDLHQRMSALENRSRLGIVSRTQSPHKP